METDLTMGSMDTKQRVIAIEEHFIDPTMANRYTGHHKLFSSMHSRGRLEDLGEARIREMDEAGEEEVRRHLVGDMRRAGREARLIVGPWTHVSRGLWAVSTRESIRFLREQRERLVDLVRMREHRQQDAHAPVRGGAQDRAQLHEEELRLGEAIADRAQAERWVRHAVATIPVERLVGALASLVGRGRAAGAFRARAA